MNTPPLLPEASPQEPAWGIVEYRGREGLQQLEADWRRLVAAMPDRAVHHTYECQLAHLEHLSLEPEHFTCLALTDGVRVRAICPLEPGVVGHFDPPTRVWGLPGNLQTPLRDVICPPDEAQRMLLPYVIRFLRGSARAPARLVFYRILETSAAWGALRSLDSRAYCADVAGASDVIDCARPFEDLAAGLPRKFRGNLRYAHHKLAALADVHFEVAADPLSLEREFRTFLELEASGWKGETGTRTAIGLDPQLTAFYRDLMAMSAEVGRCEVNALYADGRCIASQFCVRTGPEYAVLKLCYDERYPRVAPGQLLLEKTLERCCADPETKRLTLLGHQEWWQKWQPVPVPVYYAYIGVGRWSGPLLVFLLRLRLALGPRVKRWLRRLKVGVRVLGWLRPGSRSLSTAVGL